MKSVKPLSIAAMRMHLKEGMPLSDHDRGAWLKAFEALEGTASKEIRLEAFAVAIALADGARGRPKRRLPDVAHYSHEQVTKIQALREVVRIRGARKRVALREVFKIAARNLGGAYRASNIERWYYEAPLREVAEWMNDPSRVDGESKDFHSPADISIPVSMRVIRMIL